MSSASSALSLLTTVQTLKDSWSWRRWALLGTSVSAGVFALYLLFVDDERELLPEEVNGGSQQTVTSRQTVIEVKIPKDLAGQVIGPQGIVIKQIQAESKARVHFKDEASTETERILMVRGSQESAQKAEMMIKQIIHDIPEVFKIDIFVPQRFLGRLIGKNGDNIRALQRSSKAKIVIERSSDEKDPNAPKKVTVSGSGEQIELAKGFIQEQLEEDKAFRQKQQVAAELREKRTIGKKGGGCSSGGGGDSGNEIKGVNSSTSTNGPSQKKETPSLQHPKPEQRWEQNRLDGSGDAPGNTQVQLPDHKSYFEVFVSALDMKEANRIWVQLASKAEKLNNLNERLSNLYSSPHGDQYRLVKGEGDVRVNDLIAAKLLEYDESKWFRARILSLRKNGLLQVFYADYGDVAIVNDEQVRRLRQDFASEIPFQAVECLIAHIKPLPVRRVETEGVDKNSTTADSATTEDSKGVMNSTTDDEIRTFVDGVLDDVENSPVDSNDASSESYHANDVNVSEDGHRGVPANANDALESEVWTDEALDFVDDVTKNARWVLLYAKIVGYATDSEKKIPLIELVDTNGEFDVDIARSIVQAGHAIWRQDV